MNRVAQSIPPGSRLADSYSPLSANDYLALKQNGFDGVGRYLDNVTSEEIDDALAAGLGVFFIRTADNFDGAWMVTKAETLGIPKPTTLVIDDESLTVPEPQAFAEIDACAATIQKGGFSECLYDGWEGDLNAAQLEALPNVHHYWRSGSAVPIPSCEFVCYQIRGKMNVKVAGVLIDESFTEFDLKGRSMTWCIDGLVLRSEAPTLPSLPPSGDDEAA